MKKKICYSLLLLVSVLILFAGCGESKKEAKTVHKQPVRQEKPEEESEVKAAFSEEETETEEDSEEQTETELPTEQIEATETEDTEASAEIDAIVATKDTYDYVALGNSITCNDIDDEGLWWGNWGMAASNEDNDYIHIVSKWLGAQSVKPVTTTVLDLKKWELASDRNTIQKDYEEYFNEYTDLVTIQTGENITEYMETLGMDYDSLVKMIREKAPNAQILMLGEVLWPSEDIESAKHAACDAYGVTFVDMTEFLNGYESFYKSAIGAEVAGTDGESHTITNEVVAAHPNDEGMACIAQQVINQIQIRN